MMSIRTCAIDPSKDTLWAVYPLANGKLMRVGVPTVPENLDTFFTQLYWLGIRVVVYEDCYLSVNVKSYGELYALKKRIMECTRKAGLDCRLIKPDDWQIPMLFMPSDTQRQIQRKERKLRAQKLAEILIHQPAGNDDLADAVCIWFYAMGRMQFTYRHTVTIPGTEFLAPIPVRKPAAKRTYKRRRFGKC